MQAITDARQKLSTATSAAERALATPEQLCTQLQTDLAGLTAPVKAGLARLGTLSAGFGATLDRESARARTAVARQSGQRRTESNQALAALTISASADARRFEATSASLQTLGSGLDTTTGTLADGLGRARSSLSA